ncbi:MAG: enoyl-CoA hydratase/isomerase family protein, partial [Pseudomonadota bacterium]
MSASGDIEFEHRGPLGLVTLRRPQALNALTLDMIRVFSARLANWAQDSSVKAVVVQGEGDRAFCAGGDIVHIHEGRPAMAHGKNEFGYRFFEAEYSLNRQIKVFPKPYIALMDGVTMGGGVGISVHGSHRVVSERTRLAMPEASIGFFPDVGGSFLLPRLTGEMGLFIGLTGWPLGASDCVRLGIATHFAHSFLNEGLVEALRGADWTNAAPQAVVDAVLSSFDQTPPASEDEDLMNHQQRIDRCFSSATVEAIQSCLGAVGTPWSEKALTLMGRASPTSLKVALAQLRRGAAMTFDEAMQMEFQLSQVFLGKDDL